MWAYLIFMYISLVLESVTARYYRDKGGWVYFEKTGYKYKRFDEQAKFNEAIRLCQKYGAQLASIHSQEENDFIYQISKRNKNPGKGGKGAEFMWIGLRKIGSDWVWIDETKMDFTAWAKYQPDDWMNAEKCGQFYNWKKNKDMKNPDWYLKKWNDIPCNMVVSSSMCKKRK